ncbi:hypothetical protein ACHAXT_006014 [Thalassiosira profunda]
MSSADIESPPPAGIDASAAPAGSASANDNACGPLLGLYASCLLNALAFALSFAVGVSPLLAAIFVPLLLFALWFRTSFHAIAVSGGDDAREKRRWKCLAVCYAVLLVLALASVLSYFLGDVLQGRAGPSVIITYSICIAGMACTLLYLFVALCQSCR